MCEENDFFVGVLLSLRQKWRLSQGNRREACRQNTLYRGDQGPSWWPQEGGVLRWGSQGSLRSTESWAEPWKKWGVPFEGKGWAMWLDLLLPDSLPISLESSPDKKDDSGWIYQTLSLDSPCLSTNLFYLAELSHQPYEKGIIIIIIVIIDWLIDC